MVRWSTVHAPEYRHLSRPTTWSTLSRNVERLCARGWLRLVQDADCRSHLIEVTDKGQALIRKCLPAWQKAQTEVSRRLGSDTVAELRSALRKLSARN